MFLFFPFRNWLHSCFQSKPAKKMRELQCTIILEFICIFWSFKASKSQLKYGWVVEYGYVRITIYVMTKQMRRLRQIWQGKLHYQTTSKTLDIDNPFSYEIWSTIKSLNAKKFVKRKMFCKFVKFLAKMQPWCKYCK